MVIFYRVFRQAFLIGWQFSGEDPRLCANTLKNGPVWPRQTRDISLRKQATQESLRSPWWWSFGPPGGRVLLLQMPLIQPTRCEALLLEASTDGLAEEWRGNVESNLIDMKRVNRYAPASAAQARICQQYKKHSLGHTFSGHTYAESSSIRPSAWINFPSWSPRHPCHFGSGQESLTSLHENQGES